MNFLIQKDINIIGGNFFLFAYLDLKTFSTVNTLVIGKKLKMLIQKSVIKCQNSCDIGLNLKINNGTLSATICPIIP